MRSLVISQPGHGEGYLEIEDRAVKILASVIAEVVLDPEVASGFLSA
jgi:hypothetical protein